MSADGSEIANQIMAEVESAYILEDVEFDDGKLGELAVGFIVAFGLLLFRRNPLPPKRLHLFLL